MNFNITNFTETLHTGDVALHVVDQAEIGLKKNGMKAEKELICWQSHVIIKDRDGVMRGLYVMFWIVPTEAWLLSTLV